MCQLVELRGRGKEKEEEGREKRERQRERAGRRGEEEEGKPLEGITHVYVQTRAPTCMEGLHQLEDQVIECGRVLEGVRGEGGGRGKNREKE